MGLDMGQFSARVKQDMVLLAAATVFFAALSAVQTWRLRAAEQLAHKALEANHELSLLVPALQKESRRYQEIAHYATGTARELLMKQGARPENLPPQVPLPPPETTVAPGT
jgi:hypothetical protein